MSSQLQSLRIAWQTREKDYPYLVSVLRKMGHKPEFTAPNYHRLWAFVNAGRLLNQDVSQWEGLLKAETERLRTINAEFEAKKQVIERQISESKARLALLIEQGNNQ